MRVSRFIALALISVAAQAHRLDEYLQATLVSLSQDHLNGLMRLIPGVAVSPTVMAAADFNRDGVFSQMEQRAYAQQVLRDLSLSVDGHALKPRLETVSFSDPAAIREGIGEIRIEFTSELPTGSRQRTLIIENHHLGGISVYLMNCLVPQDGAIRLVAQNRNPSQSFYEVDYTQALSGGK